MIPGTFGLLLEGVKFRRTREYTVNKTSVVNGSQKIIDKKGHNTCPDFLTSLSSSFRGELCSLVCLLFESFSFPLSLLVKPLS